MEWIVEAECKSDLVDGYGLIGQELVRCMDCKYLAGVNKGPVYAVCKKNNHIFYLWGEDARIQFCSWGERKDDEQVSREEGN